MDKMRDTFLIEEAYSAKGERQYLFLIIYDIVDNRRRNKVFKLMKSYGFSVQKYSFEAYLTLKQLRILESKLNRLIDRSCDNIRIYQMNNLNKVYNYGIINQNAYTHLLIL